MTFCDIIFRKYNLYNQKHLVSLDTILFLQKIYSFFRKKQSSHPSLPFLKNNDSSDKIRSTFHLRKMALLFSLWKKNDSKKEGICLYSFLQKCLVSKVNQIIHFSTQLIDLLFSISFPRLYNCSCSKQM